MRLYPLLCVCCLLIFTLSPRDAAAQHGGPNGDGLLTATTCLPFAATTWIGGTTTDNLEIYAATSNTLSFGLLSGGLFTAAGGITTTSVVVRKSNRAAALIELREEELRRALALGAGELVDDLATWLALPPGPARHRFGVLLRRDRAHILDALRQPTPIERGWALLHALHAIEAELLREFATQTRRP